MSDVAWIEGDDLIEFNRLAVAETGEPFQLRDPGLLESAIHRPIMLTLYGHEQDVVALGCSLAVSVAQNHCFAQRNKRTAHAALFRFLWINGYTFVDPDDLALAELMLMVVDHAISEEEYTEAIGRHVIER